MKSNRHSGSTSSGYAAMTRREYLETTVPKETILNFISQDKNRTEIQQFWDAKPLSFNYFANGRNGALNTRQECDEI